MKNKILTSVMITVLFAILILTSSFIILMNLREINNTKELLINVNYLISKSEDLKIEDLNKLNELEINDTRIRITLINRHGEILYDNETTSRENHKDRGEIKDAFGNGSGYRIRYSETLDTKLMYYASKLNEDLVIRTSVPIDTVTMLEKNTLNYYLLLVLVVIIFSLFLSFRLVKIIIEPIKELEAVTLKMTDGDYKIRSKIKTNDELGTLSNSFNKMAEQLQIKIKEVVDKQNKVESILKSVDSGIIAIDEENKVISINPYIEILLGIKKNIVGECIFDYITDYDIKSFLDNEDKSEEEIKILHPIEREIRIKKSDIINGIENIGRVILFQDITDIKRVALMRTQFVANVSHELKTPLTSIKGFAETLKMVKDEETRGKFLEIINKEAERLTRLINDILVLSNIESNLVSEVEEFLPGTIIEDVINIMRKIAVNKNVEIQYNDDNCENILGDKDKFHQLVLNLVENSVKYSKDKGKVIINSYDYEEYYCLDIIDDGVGIPEEDIPRIFERFYRVDKSRKKGGTGLGLAIVKHIVKIFNGQIDVESELGVGSTFKVKIPYL
ncbi:MAG: HAMP domain-containing protein [Clostridium butyricum]|nr:HAMP domain-containing protein [Clostridium butyricum]